MWTAEYMKNIKYIKEFRLEQYDETSRKERFDIFLCNKGKLFPQYCPRHLLILNSFAASLPQYCRTIGLL